MHRISDSVACIRQINTDRLGRSPCRKAALLLGAALFLSTLLALTGHGFAQNKPAGSQGQLKTPAQDIVLQGKLQCSLKRQVTVPYRGVVTSLKVRVGDPVKAGATLAQYRLFADVTQALRKQLAAPQIRDLELSIANFQKTLASLEAKRTETKQLVAEKMAPVQTLTQIENDIQFNRQSLTVAQERLQLERQFAKDFALHLKDVLGESVKSATMTGDASLVSPIAGHVIAILSDLREGMEVAAGAPAFVIGVIDPMLMRTQVHEMEALQLALGDKAEVTLESIPNRTFEARVSRLSWTPVTPGVEQPSYYEIELSVPNSDSALREGLKGQIVIRRAGTK